MKKIFLLLSLIIGYNSFSQGIKQYLGSTNTIIISKATIKGDSGLYIAVRDTLNHPYKDSIGLLTYRPQDNRLYISNGDKFTGLSSMDEVSNIWKLTGNAGTIDGTNFIGTTDDIPFNIRVNNQKAGRIDADMANSFFGYMVGNANTIGYDNTSIGSGSFLSNIDGHNNASVGSQSLISNTTGYFNTAIGNQALYSNTTGSNNTSLGFNSDVSTGELINATAIGAKSYVTQSNSLVLGAINGVNSSSEDTKVGIGTTAPSERLHVVGNLRLVNGSQSAGRYLQTDANGLATWADAPAEVGTVSSVSVVNTNGFSGTVANATTTPAITIQTTVTGLIKGNGTAISTATADVDYATPAYADAKVADAINDGVTTIAPSQNKVFDALALKQDNLGYTAENVANKENVTIDNSAIKYPTVNLLKTGLDTKLNISDTAAMLAPYLLEADLPVITASNGLTKTGNNIKLGGTITENTLITGDYTKNLLIDGIDYFDVGAQGGVSLNGGVENFLYGPFWEVDGLLRAFTDFEVNDSAFFHGYGLLDKKLNYKTNINGTLDPLSLVPKIYADSSIALKVTANGAIVAATKTKITYDTKGLVTAGADATTTDISEGSNLYFTDERAQDATGSMIDGTLVYNDGLSSLGRAEIDGDITISEGSNTASIAAGVIVNADINAAAAIDATKIANGSVSNAEFQYLNGVTSSIQTQLTDLNSNKVTKGGDAAAFSFGTTVLGEDVTVKLGNNDRWIFGGTNGYLRRGSGSEINGLQLYGTGVGSVLAFGDNFGSVPYVGLREKGGTDTDQMEAYAQKGFFVTTGTYGATSKLTVQQDGDIILGGETQVAGAELTVIGDEDVSGNLNVQGDLTAGNIYKGSASLDFPSTIAGAVSDLTITATGAVVGDPVFLGAPNGSVTTTATYWAWVSSANTVTVRFSPKATENPASGTFKVKVFKY